MSLSLFPTSGHIYVWKKTYIQCHDVCQVFIGVAESTGSHIVEVSMPGDCSVYDSNGGKGIKGSGIIYTYKTIFPAEQ